MTLFKLTMLALFLLELLYQPNLHPAENNECIDLPPDVSFMIIDLKYKPGAIKVCEFGLGFLSGFVGHEMIYGRGSIYKALWPFLNSLQKPIHHFSSKIQDSSRVHRYDTVHYFAKYRDQSKYKNISKFHDVNALAIGYGNKAFFDTYEDVNAFSAGVLAIDYAVRPFALHKGNMHQLFKGDPILEKYRPGCMILKREYQPTLAASIIQEIPADAYVIKPINAWKGSGIFIVNSDELDAKLVEILPSDGLPIKTADQHWARTKNSYFIVETLEHSIPVQRGTHFYDPTMRVALGMKHDQGVVDMVILGAYWKMPKASVDSQASLEDRYVSHIIPQDRRSSARVGKDIFLSLKLELSAFMPEVYKKMIALTHDKKKLKDLRDQWMNLDMEAM
jgi:hypothetical protein